MLTKLIAYIIICSCIIDFSCSKKTSHGFINTKHPEQKVIIELYTGHRDGHAVIATKKIIAEQNKHSNKIIPIVIHAGFFAIMSKDYPEDLTSAITKEYFLFWKVSANPLLSINRVKRSNTPIVTYADSWWQNTADSLIKLPAVADIKISNSYSPSLRTLNTSVKYTFLKNINEPCKLVVLLTEDSVVATQRDYSSSTTSPIQDYIHRYILRAGITNAWGDAAEQNTVNNETTNPNGYITKHYSYHIPEKYNNTFVKEKNCYVVAYLYNALTYEVVQAEIKKII